MAVKIKTAEEIEKMRVAGKLASEILEMIEPHIQVGTTTEELNKICHEYALERGAYSAPLDYHGFLSQSVRLSTISCVTVFQHHKMRRVAQVNSNLQY